MNRPNRRRPAVTLVEVLIVVAIIGLLVGLILGGVQAARLSAARVAAMNDARQVLLAAHNYASSNRDQLPNVDGEQPAQGMSVLVALGPQLGGDVFSPPRYIRFKSDPSRSENLPGAGAVVPDPSGVPRVIKQQTGGESSIALNPLVFAPQARLTTIAADGTSSTIALTEHYGVCGEASFVWSLTQSVCYDGSGQRVPCVSSGMRRATFADAMYDDVLPVTDAAASPPVTRGSLPMTFQVRPPLSACDPRVPQSSLPGGLLAGFVDGSVRFLRPGLEPALFWGAVTPSRGEVLQID